MGLDDRGVERGKCRVEDCDCTEFISSTDSISCGYCGDPPAKHQNENPPTNASSSANPTVKSCSSSKGKNLQLQHVHVDNIKQRN